MQINKWDKFFLRRAKDIANELSKDPSTKVGAIIVSQDNRHISFGYNGFAAGYSEKESQWNNRELKYKLVVHAEENALLNCPFDTRGCKIYITHQPCLSCLIRIINAGIKDVIFSEYYERMNDKELWEEHCKLLNSVRQISI